MLFSKNLIAQNRDIKTYNHFVTQINNMQKEERTELDRRLTTYNSITNKINEQVHVLEQGKTYLQSRIDFLATMIRHY